MVGGGWRGRPRSTHRQRRPTHDDDRGRHHRLHHHHAKSIIITIAIAPLSFAMVRWVLDDGDDDGDGDGAGDGACLSDADLGVIATMLVTMDGVGAELTDGDVGAMVMGLVLIIIISPWRLG